MRANFFLFFFARNFFFIFFVLFHSSLGWIGRGKIFFEIFFFRAKFLFFFFFFFCARVSGWVSHRGVSHWGVDPGDRWGGGGSILVGIGGPSFWGVFMVLMIFMFLMNFDVFMSFF